MIRKLRMALANWIMPREYRINPYLPGSYYVNAVKTFPGGLTVIDKSMIKQVGPTIGNNA